MVSMGMLKASQKRMKRVALSEALMSRQPAMTCGWLAMMPTVRPLSRAKQTMMLGAKNSWGSKYVPLSTMALITAFMS